MGSERHKNALLQGLAAFLRQQGEFAFWTWLGVSAKNSGCKPAELLRHEFALHKGLATNSRQMGAEAIALKKPVLGRLTLPTTIYFIINLAYRPQQYGEHH